MNLVLFGGTEMYHYMININKNYINRIIDLCDNFYIYKSILDYIFLKQYKKGDLLLIGWTNISIFNGYNEDLGCLFFNGEDITTQYLDKTPYNKTIFFKKNKKALFNNITQTCNEHVNLFTGNKLYALSIKYSYMISIAIILKQYNIHYYFFNIDNELDFTTWEEDVVENNLNDEVEGIFTKYIQMKKNHSNWLSYQNLSIILYGATK